MLTYFILYVLIQAFYLIFTAGDEKRYKNITNEFGKIEIEGWSIPVRELNRHDFDPLAAMIKAKHIPEFKGDVELFRWIRGREYTPLFEPNIYQIKQETD